LLSPNGDPAFQKNFLRHGIKDTQKFLPKHSEKPVDPVRYEYYSNFTLGGFLALVQTWINNNMNLSVSELAKLALQLLDPGIFKEA
jgi:hypothetical protein